MGSNPAAIMKKEKMKKEKKCGTVVHGFESCKR